ncbi:hypothetical protein GCM10009630_07640 [Kribbella jejuensis]|uniref:Uncharacterized protein DUF222 n=1 Tax=Kribbella jejuensis TaxID=236068 RepID=A0A542EVT3_9ACTN|nr:HNH endonuclease signature motif containing protein [Kribbella jejuensis]TQJ19469.1 uncharacterized protein DUF222 [Kribbella jejuensis]
MDKAPEVMSEDELVRALDQADADLAVVSTRRLRLIAALDKTGYAERVGARDTRQFIEYRYRLDHYRAQRDLQLARALPKYPAISAQLDEVKLRPAQAEAIVLELEKTPSTVPVADLEFAERELARLTHLPPTQLRKATIQARDILDTDGPEPEERKAAARESLTLSSIDHGVKFKGFLANENAELLRSLITTGARPHKTLDGDPDPRPREKRQADALTTALTLAATALDAGTPSPTIPRSTTPTPAAAPTTTPAAATAATGAAATGAAATGAAATGAAAAASAGAGPARAATAASGPAEAGAAATGATGAATAPSGTAPTGTAPTGTAPTGTAPTGTAPTRTAGAHAAESDPAATGLAASSTAGARSAAACTGVPGAEAIGAAAAGVGVAAVGPETAGGTGVAPTTSRAAVGEAVSVEPAGTAARGSGAEALGVESLGVEAIGVAAAGAETAGGTGVAPTTSRAAGSAATGSGAESLGVAEVRAEVAGGTGVAPTTSRAAVGEGASVEPDSTAARGSGAEALGAETLGAEALGVEALGVEALGVAADGVEALGVEALGVEADGVAAAGAETARGMGVAPTTSRAAVGEAVSVELDGAVAGSAAGESGIGACREVVPGFGAKANITVTIDLNDLKAATADAIGQTVYSNGLSAAAIRRLACDANIIPIVLGSRSEPLDVGRCERLVTKGMRRALNARDRGCVVCGAPPVMCDAHHVIHWIDGGVTAVWNLALLCRRHHTDVHNGHWHITITNDQVHVARPSWADPPPRQAPPPDITSPLSSPPERSDVGRSPTSDVPSDDPSHRRTAARRSFPNPRTDSEDEQAVRAATYLAIWGEPLPPDHHKPSAEGPAPTPTNPWNEAATTV